MSFQQIRTEFMPTKFWLEKLNKGVSTNFVGGERGSLGRCFARGNFASRVLHKRTSARDLLALSFGLMSNVDPHEGQSRCKVVTHSSTQSIKSFQLL